MSGTIAKLASFVEKKTGLFITALAAFVVIAGAFYSLLLGNELRYLPDEQDYFSLAQNIADRGVYSLDGEQPTAYRPPGYPFFLAVFRFLGAEVVHFRMLNYLLLGLCIYLIVKILYEHSSRLAAGLGVLGVIGYPVLFYTAGTLYPQILASFLFLSVIFLFTRKEMGMRDYLLGGLLLGYLILTVPTFAFTLPVFGFWFWRNPGYHRSKGALVALAAGTFLIGLWTVRNYIVFDTFLFVSSNSGENLLLGNSENTTANAGTNADISNYTAQASELDEIERDRFYRTQAFRYIKDHKLQSTRLYLLKIVNYFNYRNELVTKAEGSSAKDLLMLLTYGPLVMVCLVRLISIKRFPASAFEVLLIAHYLLSALFNALFFTRIRFRLPFDFLLIMLSAIFLDRLIRTILFKEGEPTPVPLILNTGEKNEQNA